MAYWRPGRWQDWGPVLGLFVLFGIGVRLAAHGKKADMSTTRTHFTFRVDTWTPDGETIVEHVAGVQDYQVALAPVGSKN